MLKDESDTTRRRYVIECASREPNPIVPPDDNETRSISQVKQETGATYQFERTV